MTNKLQYCILHQKSKSKSEYIKVVSQSWRIKNNGQKIINQNKYTMDLQYIFSKISYSKIVELHSNLIPYNMANCFENIIV